MPGNRITDRQVIKYKELRGERNGVRIMVRGTVDAQALQIVLSVLGH